MLRVTTEKVLRNTPEPASAAFAICEMLEDEVGLNGNGWFDDDAEMIVRLGGVAETDDVEPGCLRKTIENMLTSTTDPVVASIEVCKYLDDRIGLSGNGWFDGDELMD